MNIKSLYHSCRKKKILKTFSNIINIKGTSVLLPSFNIRLDAPTDKTILNIGENCIIGGNFIFESGKGEITIGNDSYIGNSTLISHSSINIGNHVTVAWGCTIYDHDSHSLNFLDRRVDVIEELKCLRAGKNMVASKNWQIVNSKPIVIEDDAWIGMNVLILKGVRIGEGAIVGAGSVVTHDVPPFTVVAGNPAKEIRTLK